MTGTWRGAALLVAFAAVTGTSGCKKGEATQTGGPAGGTAGAVSRASPSCKPCR